MTKTIDMTPTWKGVLPLLLAGIEDGTPESRAIAIEELNRMAIAADAYNKLQPSAKNVGATDDR